MFWMDHDLGWWGYAGMGVGMLLFWALIIAGIIALVGRVSGTANTRKAGNALVPQLFSPEQALDNRFSRGEIGETEYQQRLAVLHGRVHR